MRRQLSKVKQKYQGVKQTVTMQTRLNDDVREYSSRTLDRTMSILI